MSELLPFRIAYWFVSRHFKPIGPHSVPEKNLALLFIHNHGAFATCLTSERTTNIRFRCSWHSYTIDVHVWWCVNLTLAVVTITASIKCPFVPGKPRSPGSSLVLLLDLFQKRTSGISAFGFFYGPDIFPDMHPSVSKHGWDHKTLTISIGIGQASSFLHSSPDCSWKGRWQRWLLVIFTAQCYASAVYVVIVCPSVCHMSRVYQNG